MNNIPTLINIKKSPEYAKNPNYVYIGRPSIYGNPFTHIPYIINGKVLRSKDLIQVKNVQEAIESYKRWICGLKEVRINNIFLIPPSEQQILDLGGKILGCYCVPNPCHGQVLIEIFKRGLVKYSQYCLGEFPNKE